MIPLRFEYSTLRQEFSYTMNIVFWNYSHTDKAERLYLTEEMLVRVIKSN